MKNMMQIAKLVPLATVALMLLALLYYAPGIITMLLVIFLIGAVVGLLYITTLSNKAPPPWKKTKDE